MVYVVEILVFLDEIFPEDRIPSKLLKKNNVPRDCVGEEGFLKIWMKV